MALLLSGKSIFRKVGQMNINSYKCIISHHTPGAIIQEQSLQPNLLIQKSKTNLKKRIIATIIDYSLVSIATYIYILLFGTEDSNGENSVSGLMALPIPIFWTVYFVVIEANYGATLAHQGLYLKVLTLKGKEIEWTQTFKRHLLDPIDIFIYGIPAIITIINTDKHPRLGDLRAQAIVVDTKDPEQFSISDATSR